MLRLVKVYKRTKNTKEIGTFYDQFKCYISQLFGRIDSKNGHRNLIYIEVIKPQLENIFKHEI